MKTKKLLARLTEYLTGSTAEGEAEVDGLLGVLKKLKKRQRKLEAELEEAGKGKEKKLKRELKVVKAQHKKGHARYKELCDEQKKR